MYVENNLKKFLELKVEIAEIAKHQNLKYKKDDSLFEESLKFYELIECAYQSIIFSFTALEASLHTTKNQHQPIFMGLGVKKLTNCRNTALSLFNNTKRKPSINKSKPNANKLA